MISLVFEEGQYRQFIVRVLSGFTAEYVDRKGKKGQHTVRHHVREGDGEGSKFQHDTAMRREGRVQVYLEISKSIRSSEGAHHSGGSVYV